MRPPLRSPLYLPEPTPAALRQAWGRMSSPSRPATLEAALAHPVWGICLRAAARELVRTRAFTHWPQVKLHPLVDQCAARGVRMRPRAAKSTGGNAGVDLKRRAANDLDD